MKASLVLKQIFRQAPIALGFLMAFMFISGLALTVKSYDEKVHLISILPFLYVMIFAGMAIGKALENLRQTYVWSVNLAYKKLHHRVLIALPLSISFILMIVIVLAGSGNEIFVLLGLMIYYTMIFAHDMQKSSIPMVTIYTTFIILMQFKRENIPFLHENYRVFILFSFYGVMLIGSIINYRKNSDYPEDNKSNPPKRKLLIHRFKRLQPNYFKKDVGLSLTENGLTFPLFGIFLGFIVVGYTAVMNVFIVNEMKTGLILTLMFILNFLMGFSFKFNMRQVKKYAHVFKGQNHAGIKSQLIKAMDKKLLLNNLSFIVIILSFMFLLDLPFNKLELIVTIFISFVFIFNTYLFVIALKVDTKTEVGFALAITYAVLFAVVYALTVLYKESFFSWSFDLGILIFAMFVRFLAEWQFKKAKFEDLMI